jgi:hypothetical protein
MYNQMKLLLVLAILFLVWSFFPGFRSGYAEITTNLGDLVPDMFSNPTALECQAGLIPNGDFYSQENGQGVCQGQQYVHKLAHEYKIVN